VGGRIAYRFHARDLHLVMGPAAAGMSVKFRVLVDGKPPGAAHGIDVDEQGNGTVTEQRMYTLIRQPMPIADRQVEIEFSAAPAAAQLGIPGPVYGQPALPTIKAGAHTSLGPLKNINAGLLNIAYAEAGPAGGPPVILLHGWPYDIHSFVDVTPALASAGYRVLVPYLRGYGATRFLSSESVRNGQPSALAVDVIDFMDALKIDKAVLAGFDWGLGRLILSRRSGPSASRRWSPSAAI
jgi:hypothetical protein